MGTGRHGCPLPVLVCFAFVAGGALSMHAEYGPFPRLWKVSAHSNDLTREVVFTSDGVQLISAGDDGNVRFLRRSDGGLITNVTAHSGAVYGMAFSPDGRSSPAQARKSAATGNYF